MGKRGPRLTTKVITLRETQAFVDRHHRHHRSPVGHKLSIGVRIKGTDDLVSVAIVSRPVARLFDHGGDTLEVSHPGRRNGRFSACRRLHTRRSAQGTPRLGSPKPTSGCRPPDQRWARSVAPRRGVPRKSRNSRRISRNSAGNDVLPMRRRAASAEDRPAAPHVL